MEGARLKRIMREIAACEKDPDDEITVNMIDGTCSWAHARITFSSRGYFSGPHQFAL